MLRLGAILNITTEYRCVDLVEALEENKAIHIKEYAEAKAQYDIKKTEVFAKLKKAATEAITKETTGPIHTVISEISGLVKPVDATKMYDQYIKLFSMSAKETIELSTSDANSIFNDEWDWAVSAKTANYAYTGSIR